MGMRRISYYGQLKKRKKEKYQFGWSPCICSVAETVSQPTKNMALERRKIEGTAASLVGQIRCINLGGQQGCSNLCEELSRTKNADSQG